jgi:hypothetical protein
MQDFVDLFGRGHFTCGAKYICFKPDASDKYMKIAQAAPGTDDSAEWILFAEGVVEHLNALASTNQQIGDASKETK